MFSNSTLIFYLSNCETMCLLKSQYIFSNVEVPNCFGHVPWVEQPLLLFTVLIHYLKLALMLLNIQISAFSSLFCILEMANWTNLWSRSIPPTGYLVMIPFSRNPKKKY